MTTDSETIEHLNELVRELQEDLDFADELHFDECEDLHIEISELKRKLKLRGVN